MKTPHQILTELTLELTTLEVHLRPLVGLWQRVGGASPGARLDGIYARLKALRAALDGQDAEVSRLVGAASDALYERNEARRELAALKALAFVNRSVTGEVQ
jgi:hypothetical protein